MNAALGNAGTTVDYVAARLGDAYPVLYRGDGGLVAHECILDLRPLTDATGISDGKWASLASRNTPMAAR